MLFRLVPNRHVPRTHALIGGLVSALAFESSNRILGYYISHFPTYKLVYGAFASIPIFLMWIYLSWLTILFGAVIAASLSHWRTPAEHDLGPATRLLDALHILQILEQGLHKGSAHTLPELSKSMLLGYDTLETILEELSGVDMVSKLEGNGWVLTREASHIRLTELVRLYVLDRESLPPGKNDDPSKNWLAACAAELEQGTDITLQELFARQTA